MQLRCLVRLTYLMPAFPLGTHSASTTSTSQRDGTLLEARTAHNPFRQGTESA